MIAECQKRHKKDLPEKWIHFKTLEGLRRWECPWQDKERSSHIQYIKSECYWDIIQIRTVKNPCDCTHCFNRVTREWHMTSSFENFKPDWTRIISILIWSHYKLAHKQRNTTKQTRCYLQLTGDIELVVLQIEYKWKAGLLWWGQIALRNTSTSQWLQ